MSTQMRITVDPQVHMLAILHELLTHEPSLIGHMVVTLGPTGHPALTILGQDVKTQAGRCDLVRTVARRMGWPVPDNADWPTKYQSRAADNGGYVTTDYRHGWGGLDAESALNLGVVRDALGGAS